MGGGGMRRAWRMIQNKSSSNLFFRFNDLDEPAQKKFSEKWNGKSWLVRDHVRHPSWKLMSIFNLGHARVKGNHQQNETDWLVKQPQVVCKRKEQKCWGPWGKPRTLHHKLPGWDSRSVEELEESKEHHTINPLEKRAEVLRSLRKAKNTTPSIPGGESRGVEELEKSWEHHTINRLEERAEVLRSLRKAENTTPSIPGGESRGVEELEKSWEHHTINPWGREQRCWGAWEKPRTPHHQSPGGDSRGVRELEKSQEWRTPHHQSPRGDSRGVEELEKSQEWRTPHHQSPGGESRGVEELEKSQEWTHHQSPGGETYRKGQCLAFYLERKR